MKMPRHVRNPFPLIIRFRILILFLIPPLTSFPGAEARAATSPGLPERPNILVILADDLGFSDLGCYGGEIETPHLDSLARQGLRFTQFYNTSRCWPTRSAILTGYYPQAIRRDALPGGGGGGAGGKRPAWARLLPEYLRPLGYRTYHSGKWHIDGPRLAAGFDHSYVLDDHDRNFSPRNHSEDDVPLPAVPPGTDYFTSTAIVDHALRCLNEHATKHPAQPFFHYLCFTSPHFPLQAPAQDIARYQDRYHAGWDAIRLQRAKRQRELGFPDFKISEREPEVRPAWNLASEELRRRTHPDEVGNAPAWSNLSPDQQRFQAAKMAVHAAMVDRMDREIGRILDWLRQSGRAENTLILFLSDNGASAEQIVRGDGHDPGAAPGSARSFLCLGPGWSTAANTPFRRHKSWTHEGGIATPLIVYWPAGLGRKGAFRHTLGHVVDLPPTLLELAGGSWPSEFQGIPVPPPHGVSLMPALPRDRRVPHEPLWWFHEKHQALRNGDWKIVRAAGTSPSTDWELYNMRRDRTETRDVAARYPERVRALVSQWERRAENFRQLAAPETPYRGAETIRKE